MTRLGRKKLSSAQGEKIRSVRGNNVRSEFRAPAALGKKGKELCGHIRDGLPKKFSIVGIRQYIHIGFIVIKLPGDALETSDQ